MFTISEDRADLFDDGQRRVIRAYLLSKGVKEGCSQCGSTETRHITAFVRVPLFQHRHDQESVAIGNWLVLTCASCRAASFFGVGSDFPSV